MPSPKLLKTEIPYVCWGRWRTGGGGGDGLSQLLMLRPKLPKTQIPCFWEGVFDYVRHLMRIWGELQNFDKNFSHSLKASASQIVSCGD